jgi:hypothetical protein|tara:strand:- start:1059 stop:1514 length:456 start_codon:yes stop_codon:yes gene_type:complete
MATTATINIASDIYPGFGGISKSMTLTKAGTINDIEETTGFSRRKFNATTAKDLIVMADLQVETADSKAAKLFVKNIGDGKGNVDKSVAVSIGLGTVANAGTTAVFQEISKLYGGDWMMIPLTGIDATGDVQVVPETNDTVVLEYVMFFEQ